MKEQFKSIIDKYSEKGCRSIDYNLIYDDVSSEITKVAQPLAIDFTVLNERKSCWT